MVGRHVSLPSQQREWVQWLKHVLFAFVSAIFMWLSATQSTNTRGTAFFEFFYCHEIFRFGHEAIHPIEALKRVVRHGNATIVHKRTCQRKNSYPTQSRGVHRPTAENYVEPLECSRSACRELSWATSHPHHPPYDFPKLYLLYQKTSTLCWVFTARISLEVWNPTGAS